MALIAAGTFNGSAAFVDDVRATTYAAEAGVGAGTTIVDGGATRNIAECGFTNASGERIDIGSIAFDASYTWAIRFIYRTNGTGGQYASLISRGGVFENNTQGALGMRAESTGNNDFYFYGRNGSSLVGFENSTGPALTAGTAYTLVGRWQSGTQQLWLCNPDIGGAGINRVTAGSGTSSNGTDGSQNIFLGGPAAYTNANEYNAGAGLLGALIYDTYLTDGELDAVAADFYGQIPASGPTINTQPTAQTAVISEGGTAAFTIAATTSGGSLACDWELETSVGGGVYANVANGSGGTWTGQAAATLNGTFTAATLSGRRVRCNVSDDNGSTTSNAVALTIRAGDTISTTSGTTNGSGVSTTAFTSDVVAGTGVFAVVSATSGNVTKYVALRPETP